MLSSRTFFNSRPDSFAVLEVVDDTPAPDVQEGRPPLPPTPRRFVPLKSTRLAGAVTGPLATLTLTQTFTLADSPGTVIEALYRFPLPGDAAVNGVRVKFGDVEIHITLKERETAEEDYRKAKQTGRQAAIVTRESPDVFTLAVAGIKAGQDVVVQTDYVQLAKPEGTGWSLRIPLTTSPRYVRTDEANSRHASGQPLAILRDPGHMFALDLTIPDADGIASHTHAIVVDNERVRLRDGDVIPDRDCVLSWQPRTTERPALRVWTETDSANGKMYFLALCAPPKFANAKKVPREVILLVDHSGSMSGAKWEAADWAVEKFLTGLGEHDSFALGLFHSTTKWFAQRPQKATSATVRDAVKYLKDNRDNGGTELGVALEQALDRARSADTPSRHVLILTDAEVSDAGRILRLADAESVKPNRRRVSVLCVDAAPNAALASELAERGGGVSRFLTSNPDEDDITTALDDVLADWSAPVLTGLTLEVNRAGAEAAGRMVTLIAPGGGSGIDIGDLPAGRPVWVIGRVPVGSEPLKFRLRTGAEVVAEDRADAKRATGLKALFGADRVRRLEYVMNANYSGEDLRGELARLGYETSAISDAKVYAENARDASTKVVRELLVRESLAMGVPCSETAFVAVRSEVGQPVTETRIVANALPAGWSEQAFGSQTARGIVLSACLAPPPAEVDSVDSCLMEFDDEDFDDEDDTPAPSKSKRRAAPPLPPRAASGGSAKRFRAASTPGQRLETVPSASTDIRISVAAGQHTSADGAVLFDSASVDAGQFTFLSVAFADKSITADAIDPELTLLLFVGDLAVPRARVKLADVLRQGGRRPLNIRRDAGQPVCLTLSDPVGAWKSGVPAMEIVVD